MIGGRDPPRLQPSLVVGERSVLRRGHTARVDVLIVGPWPPPLGGISAHVARTVDILRAEGFEVAVLDHYHARGRDPVVRAGLRRNPVRYFLEVRRHPSRLVHYHHSRIESLVAVGLAARLDRSRQYVLA